MIVIDGIVGKFARNVAKLKMTASNVLIGLDIVKPAVQFDNNCLNKEEQSSKFILKINLFTQYKVCNQVNLEICKYLHKIS